MGSKRRWWILGVAVVVVAAASLAFFLHRRHAREKERDAHLGAVCGSSDECPDAVCMHESTGEAYCAKLCETDDDCSAAFVCDPTRSLLRHACMKAGVETGFASNGRPIYRRVREP
jgi:hypothetical protein